MTKRKPTKHEDDVRRNLRKSAEINPAQSPHDGIHTCSKGCKKPGCNRGLRDTIEEQDAQIEALKQDLLEQTAAVRHLRMERVHDINHIGGQQEELAALRSQFANSEQDYARLKAEVERLTFDPLTYLDDHGEWMPRHIHLVAVEWLEVRNAELVTENARLKAEVERLRASSFVTAVPVEQYERVVKAGDAMADEVIGCYNGEGYDPADSESLRNWNAAKEGKPSV